MQVSKIACIPCNDIMRYEVYTDGSYSKKENAGGCAYIILVGEGERQKIKLRSSKSVQKTEIARMELLPIVDAISSIVQDNCLKAEIHVFTDSAYCYNPVNQNWLAQWAANGWRNKNEKEIVNSDLWAKLHNFINLNKTNIKFHKIKGHSGIEYNEWVDKAAKEALQRGINRTAK